MDSGEKNTGEPKKISKAGNEVCDGSMRLEKVQVKGQKTSTNLGREGG